MSPFLRYASSVAVPLRDDAGNIVLLEPERDVPLGGRIF